MLVGLALVGLSFACLGVLCLQLRGARASLGRCREALQLATAQWDWWRGQVKSLEDDLQGLEDNLVVELRRRDDLDREVCELEEQLDCERELLYLERRKRADLEGRLRDSSREVLWLQEQIEEWKASRRRNVQRANRLEAEKQSLQGRLNQATEELDKAQQTISHFAGERDRFRLAWEQEREARAA